jgi:hypothetical protein
VLPPPEFRRPISAFRFLLSAFCFQLFPFLCQNFGVQKPAMFYPLLFLVFWTGLMLAADYVVIETCVRQASSVNFVATTGKMVQSEIHKGAVSHRGVAIGYNYSVNGINYTGHRYRYDDRHAASQYSTTIDAYPRWSERKVYYNANDPADSILDPGLDGCDLLFPLFAMPLNVVTLALWVAVVRSARRIKTAEPAGGVRIVRRPGETRAQIAAFSPGAAALAALGGASFFLAFPVVSIGGFAPGMTLMLVVWALVLASVAAAFLWALKRNYSGVGDLRIDEVSNIVTVPRIVGRNSLLTLARKEIVAVSLERLIAKTPSGDYFSFLPALDCVPGHSGSPTVKLVTWGWTEGKARAFGQWLSEQLGVEFRGIQGDSTL